MRKLTVILIAIAVAIGFSCCKRTDDGVLPKGHKYEAKLNLNLNIVSDDGIMTSEAKRSGAIGGPISDALPIADDDLIAIEIFKGTDRTGDRVGSGLFKGETFNVEDFEGLTITLEHQMQYYMVATVIRHGEGVVYSDINKTYGTPFNDKGIDNRYGLMSHTDKDYFTDLTAQVKEEGVLNLGDRFYAETVFTADYANQNVSINLKRWSVKFNYNITDLYPGHKVFFTVYVKKGDDLAPVAAALPLGKPSPEIEITDHQNDIFTYPFVNGAAQAEVKLAAYIRENGDRVKIIEKRFNLKPKHVYTVCIDANPSKGSFSNIILDDEWIYNEEIIVLEEEEEEQHY